MLISRSQKLMGICICICKLQLISVCDADSNDLRFLTCQRLKVFGQFWALITLITNCTWHSHVNCDTFWDGSHLTCLLVSWPGPQCLSQALLMFCTWPSLCGIQLYTSTSTSTLFFSLFSWQLICNLVFVFVWKFLFLLQLNKLKFVCTCAII